MANEEKLQTEIIQLKKENEVLQDEIVKDIKLNSDLMIKNIELAKENEQLKEENKKLQTEIKQTEEVILEVADKLYKQEFGE